MERVNGNELLNSIIALTMTRDNDKTSEEFLKSLGIENTDLSEEQVIDIATFNAIQDFQKSQIKTKESLKWLIFTIGQMNQTIQKESKENGKQ